MTKTYQAFLSEPLAYSVASYGKGVALTLNGPREWIDRAFNMLCNLDGTRQITRTRDDQAHISCSLSRLKAAIKLHLYLGIMMNREVDVIETWVEGDEEAPGVYTLDQDEKAADALAETEARDWMARLEAGSLMGATLTGAI